MTEEWRDIPGYGGKCQISINTPIGKCRIKNYHNGKNYKIVNNNIRPNGRLYWTLYKGKNRKCSQAARWIAITYPELVQNEYFEGAQIDHIDGNKLNNHPSNLRWVTIRENCNNPITRAKLGGKPISDTAKEKISNSNTNNPALSKPVIQYTLDGKFVAEYPSQAEAARQNQKANFKKISRCCNGKQKTHIGYCWSFK